MSQTGQGRQRRQLWHRLTPLIVLAIVIAAGWILYRDLRHYSLANFRDALRQIEPWRMLSCVGLMVINYVVLIGYDVLAVKSIGHPLPLKRVAFASFVGFAMSYNFGSLLGGGSVRYRFYSSWGLRPMEIVRLVMILGITFWFGVFGLAGLVFLWRPIEIAPGSGLNMQTTTPLAWALISLAIAYLLVTAVWRRPIRVWGKEFRLPGLRMSSAQLSVAALDLVIAAACFYILFPAALGVHYGEILGIYLLAVVAGVLMHAPGGAGVFELIVVTMAPHELRPDYFAICMVFRGLYNWLPLLVAGPMYALYERELHLQQRAERDRPTATRASS